MGLDQRTDYDWGTLDESTVDGDPVAQLAGWLQDAERLGVPEFNAMAVTTVDDSGRPRSRNVLLRGVTAGGLQFFTNRDSAKGRDLAADDRVCVLFSWLGIHRQVRIQGRARPIDDAASDEYFASRPRSSQLGAWASEQSTVLPGGRDELTARLEAVTDRYEGGPVPRPPFWGGYSVTPDEYEFWQGRPSRLHDRIRYLRRDDGAGWVVDRLAP